MQQPSISTPWYKRPEAGHDFGLWLTSWIARVLGRTAVHAFIAPIAAYYLIVRRTERRASRAFLSRVLHRRVSLAASLRHFYTFARVSVDRALFQSGGVDRIPVRISGQRRLEEEIQRTRGCILLSAHFGSIEAARQAGGTHPGPQLRILLDRAVNQRLLDRLERLDPDLAASIIDASAEPRALILRIGECLQSGEWIGWLGDRYRCGERTVVVDFLGSPARFPASPFIVAHLFQVPVFLVLATFDGNGYDVSVEELVGDPGNDARDRDIIVRECATRYADRLAYHVKRSPYNWFNFYDFWAS